MKWQGSQYVIYSSWSLVHCVKYVCICGLHHIIVPEARNQQEKIKLQKCLYLPWFLLQVSADRVLLRPTSALFSLVLDTCYSTRTSLFERKQCHGFTNKYTFLYCGYTDNVQEDSEKISCFNVLCWAEQETLMNTNLNLYESYTGN